MAEQNRAAGQTAEARIEQWLTQYGDQVLRTCYVWLKDRQLAEDALQETFFKAWQAMKRFEQRGPTSEKAWLMRIAVNTCRDMMRGSWFRRVERAVTLDDLPPSLLSVSDEDRSLFLSVLDLPLKHRQVILLYYYNGLTLRECGEALKINASSVRYRLKQAESLLKTQLEGGISHAY